MVCTVYVCGALHKIVRLKSDSMHCRRSPEEVVNEFLIESGDQVVQVLLMHSIQAQDVVQVHWLRERGGRHTALVHMQPNTHSVHIHMGRVKGHTFYMFVRMYVCSTSCDACE